ncbi:MAG: hypothetical protein DMF66_14155 [Acidobacteria bacterium]|nr:MAG: hypothetical protein DMF66_14155 [Acidobacteriota bacterium]
MPKYSTPGQATRRAPNAGSFRRGPDPRRHRFTRDEQVAGFWAALESLTTRYDDDRARTFGKFLRREGKFSR